MSSLANWETCPLLAAPSVSGSYVRIDPFSAADVRPLWYAFGGTTKTVNERLKYFYFFGNSPFKSPEDLENILKSVEKQDAACVTVFRLLPSNEVCGMASLLNAVPLHGTVEVGYVAHGLGMSQSPVSTEAHYLLAKHVFDHGYRRLEWKCDSNNSPSRSTALRLGFQYEGTFRQHRVLWNRQNRDTCWYSMLDCEWPQRQAEFEAWLSQENFDSSGMQLKRLGEIRAELSK
jgi:RimJ/RimL family protein N-acetyltransferase